jgi:hypothetical protein
VARWLTLRFHSPLVEPDVRISRIRLSDKETQGAAVRPVEPRGSPPSDPERWSGRFVGSHHSPCPSPRRAASLNSGPFPPPELPGFLGTTSPSATPGGPACPSRASGWGLAPHRRGFPCCRRFPCVDMPSPLPRWDRWFGSFGMRGSQPLGSPQRRRPSPLSRRVGSHVEPFEACSVFTRVTACRLAAPPSGTSVSEAPTASLPPPPLR